MVLGAMYLYDWIRNKYSRNCDVKKYFFLFVITIEFSHNFESSVSVANDVNHRFEKFPIECIHFENGTVWKLKNRVGPFTKKLKISL